MTAFTLLRRGLSKMLDGTLREGAHDMRVFGLGFLRSVATYDDYVHFTTGMYHYYGAMEERFARADRDSVPGKLWKQFPELPRQEKIKRDLQMVGAWKENLEISPATQQCEHRIFPRSLTDMTQYCGTSGTLMPMPSAFARIVAMSQFFHCISMPAPFSTSSCRATIRWPSGPLAHHSSLDNWHE